jgi:hypothetical protein
MSASYIVPSVLVAIGTAGVATVAGIRAFLLPHKPSFEVKVSRGDHQIRLNAESISRDEMAKIIEAIVRIDDGFPGSPAPSTKFRTTDQDEG